MKRLTLFVVLVLAYFLFTTDCIGEIVEYPHSVISDGSYLIYSLNTISSVGVDLCFQASSKKESLTILLQIAGKKHYDFSKQSKIKIDDEIYDLAVRPDSKRKSPQYTKIISKAKITLSSKIAKKILSAKEVSLQIYFSQHSPVELKISNNILEEWKEVLTKTNIFLKQKK
jgi:hypothetical protein